MKTRVSVLKSAVIFAALAMLGTGTMVSRAEAASAAVCQNYASTSVQQQGTNLSESCGYSGYRWHGWYDGHYQWCLGQSSRRISRELRRRDRELDHCHDDF